MEDLLRFLLKMRTDLSNILTRIVACVLFKQSKAKLLGAGRCVCLSRLCFWQYLIFVSKISRYRSRKKMLAMRLQQLLVIAYELDTVAVHARQTMVGGRNEQPASVLLEIGMIEAVLPTAFAMNLDAGMTTVQLDRHHPGFADVMNTEGAEIEVLTTIFLLGEVGQDHLMIGTDGIGAEAQEDEIWMMRPTYHSYGEILGMCQTYNSLSLMK